MAQVGGKLVLGSPRLAPGLGPLACGKAIVGSPKNNKPGWWPGLLSTRITLLSLGDFYFLRHVTVVGVAAVYIAAIGKILLLDLGEHVVIPLLGAFLRHLDRIQLI